MTTKFLIKSILAVGLVVIMSSTVGAIVSSTTVSGCTLYKKSLGQCSIFVEGLLKGLGNVTSNPTAFTVILTRISGRIFCKNPAGNSIEANGVPFQDVEVSPVGADTINQGQVTRNGRALSEIVFHDPQLIAELAEAGFTVSCQNSNWIQVIVVTQLEVTGKQLSDPTPNDDAQCLLDPGPNQNFIIDSTCDVDDTLRNSCRIEEPYFSNPASAIGVAKYDYDCSEICHSSDPTQCDVNIP
jgi:hypothetical protein